MGITTTTAITTDDNDDNDDEYERNLRLVHALNTVAVWIASPTFTHVFHRYYIPLFQQCVRYLDSSEYEWLMMLLLMNE